MNTTLKTFVVVFLWLVAVLPTQAVGDSRPPNIVIIFIDDMGYADIGPFTDELPGYETPHIDRMASEGRIFTDFHVTQAVCSASRAGLLTGCYNVRVGIQGALNPKAKHGLHADEVTLAEICKQRDYATACIGKWHLGHHEKFLPLQHGFDEYYGLPYSNDMWPYHPNVSHLPEKKRRKRWPPLPLIEQNEIVDPEVTPEDQARLTTEYTKRSVEFIEKNKNRPFFLYLAHTMVHVPLFVSEKFAGKTSRGLFGDVVTELDWSVGRILAALREHNLEENTLVIFTSDNGPWLNYGDHAGSAGPLREGKGTMFEGGCRVPTVMWWPGQIPADTQCDKVAMTIDILPTVANLVEAKLPEHKIDGKDIWPLIAGQPDAESPHKAYYLYYKKQLQAVRMGRWKLHFPHSYRHYILEEAGCGGKPGCTETRHIDLSLFDLEEDIGETQDVKDQHPEIVDEMSRLADRMREELGDGPQRGSGRRKRGEL